jgi:hypothetical protein
MEWPRRVARDHPVASPNFLRRPSVMERRVRDHIRRWSKVRDELAVGDLEVQYTKKYQDEIGSK